MKEDKKKRKKKDKNTSKVFESKIPNIRPVPQNCIHLGDLVYLVPGDGKCGPYLEMRFLGGNSEGK